ncbi:MAG: hypothetical protein OEZ02_09760, partial [Anaerolineae bacterium]|nr:hypothetical protein [Anaerolineae bacterium]
MNRYTKSLILILILVTVAVWIDLPNNPGIHYTNAAGEPYDRDFPTKLGLDLVGGVQALLQVDLPEDIEIDPDSMRTASGIIEKRVNGLGVNEAVVQLAGDRRILVELPGETDPERALETLKQTGLLEFVEVGTQYLTPGTPISTDFGVGGAAGGVFPLLEEATETVAGVEEVDGTATPDAEGSKNTEE